MRHLSRGFRATCFHRLAPSNLVTSATVLVVAMVGSMVLANSQLALQPVDPSQLLPAYLVAVAGWLVMLSGVGRIHSLWEVARGQAKEHLNAALEAWRRMVNGADDKKDLPSVLNSLLATLNASDEGAIYLFDHTSGTLRLEAGAGARPWFQRFPAFWPEEGIVGQAYRLNKPVIYQDVRQLRQCHGNLSQRNLEILEQVTQNLEPPEYSLAVPIFTEAEAIGVVLLSRQHGALDASEVHLVEEFAAHLATAIREPWPGPEMVDLGQKMDSIQNMLNLALASGEEVRVLKELLQGVGGVLGDRLYPPGVAAILCSEHKGAVSVTQWAPELPEGFRFPAAGEHLGALQDLFLQWTAPAAQTFPAYDQVGRILGELLGAASQTRFSCFPLYYDGKVLGMLAVPLPPNCALSPGQGHSIQQIASVSALCLQVIRHSEAHSRQTRELQHEDELRRSFLSYITHEFRTPLASLKTSFELIQESEKVRNLEDPYQRLLNNVRRSVAMLEQLTDDLSEVANISAGGVILNKSLTSPESIVYPVLETTAPLSQLKDQSLEIEIPQKLPKLMVDSRRLEQVLTNMVSNAIKYTPAGGEIRTTVSQQNGCIKFEVSDTGPGILQEDQEKVFDPFYRLPQQDNEKSPGTGLGLALAKSLVELHGGKIWVESAPHEGSTFCFTIPIETRN